MPQLEFNLEKAREEIAARKARLVLVQFPEGLKQRTTEIIESLSSNDAEVIALMDPCFGACDLGLNQMKQLKADLLIHLGHAPITSSTNAIHIPLSYRIRKAEIEAVAKKAVKECKAEKFEKIAICTTIQYIPQLARIKEMLENEGLRVFTGKGSRAAEPGQVLGCDYSAVKEVAPAVDAVLFFGDGLFHPLGAAFSTEKPVIFADLREGKIRELDRERNLFMRKRFAAIARAKEAESFGIIISTKQGQRRKEKAVGLKKFIEAKGRKAYLFAADFVNESYFKGVNIDCYVSTACPRIAIDDAAAWDRPIINPIELEIALGERKWGDFKLEEL